MFRKTLVLSLSLLLLVSGLTVAGFGREANLPKDEQVVPLGIEGTDWGLGELTPGLPGGEMVSASRNLPKTFNDMVAKETSSTAVTALLNAGLTSVSPSNGRVVPGLAKSWEISEDKKTYTFHLREYLKFSDGEPLTAEDVVFSFNQLIFNEKVKDSTSEQLKVQGNLPEVKKVDELTVKITTPTVFGPFLKTVGFVPIYPKHKFKGMSGKKFNSAWGQQTAEKNPEDIVGAGPFRLKEYVPEQKVVLERNPYFYRRGPNGVQLPYLDKWVVLKVADTDARASKFKTHETDIYEPSADKIPFLLENEDKENWNVKVKEGPRGAPLGTRFLVFNWDTKKEALAKVFQKKQFRRAVSHAVDRQSIIDNVYNGFAVPITSPVGKLSPYYNEKAEEKFPLEYNLDKAKKMLDELGLKDSNGNGIRELPNGDKLSFTILASKGSQPMVDTSNTIISDLNEIGFDVKFNPVKFNSLVQQLLGGKYQAVVIGLTGSVEPNNSAGTWKSDGPIHMWHLNAKNNPVEWEKRVDELFTEGLKHIGVENRKPYYDEWQAIAAEQVPMIYTANQIFLHASEKEVQNTETFSAITAAVGHAEFLWKE